MKIHAYPRLYANMKFLYGPHTFTLPGFEGPRADVETRDDVAGDRRAVRDSAGDHLPDRGASEVNNLDALLLAVMALTSMAFYLGELP